MSVIDSLKTQQEFFAVRQFRRKSQPETLLNDTEHLRVPHEREIDAS
jgi:hypothetical protein